MFIMTNKSKFLPKNRLTSQWNTAAFYDRTTKLVDGTYE